MTRRGIVGAVVVLAVGTCSASAASARTVSQWHQVQVYSPVNVDANVGWLAQAMFDLKAPPVRIRVGGTTYAGPWNNATFAGGTMSDALKILGRRYALDNVAVYSDRALTAAERRRYRVGARLYRDADVLVVSAGHPACAGLTLAQARAIARGEVTRWSQVAAGGDGAISVRYPERNGAAELRFGTRNVARRTAKGVRYRPSYGVDARGSADGGLAAAAHGDRGIAALTSWSAARARGGTVCIVPLGGVTASAESVASLRFPGAYPVDVVVRRSVRDAYTRKIVAGMLAHMRSEQVRRQLRGRGLLVAGDPLPAAPTPSVLPPQAVPLAPAAPPEPAAPLAAASRAAGTLAP